MEPVSLGALWLPILLSAVAVFFGSFVMWMVLPHHKSEWKALPDEDGIMNALREQDVAAPGQYVFPHCATNDEMKDPAFIKKYSEGPSGMMIVRPKGGWKMGKSLGQSFLYNVLLTTIAAYLATIALPRGADSGTVFRFIATAVWFGCAGALGWSVIWWARSVSSTLKEVGDGLVYGLMSGLIFMWLWPAATTVG